MLFMSAICCMCQRFPVSIITANSQNGFDTLP